MRNLYSVTKGQQAIRDVTGNLPPLFFGKTAAVVARHTDVGFAVAFFHSSAPSQPVG